MTCRERITEILQNQTGERRMQSIKAKAIADLLVSNGTIVQNRGKWLDNPTGYTECICSACFGMSAVDQKGHPVRSNYCPYCGAKMDLEV